MAEQYKVTSVGVNPAKDRSYRMRTYFLTMTVRIACVISLFWVRGPWIILVAAGAIVLPYFAVLIANATSHVAGDPHDTPAPLELSSPDQAEQTQETATPASHTLIVIDVPPERRSSRGEPND